jgi:hypothetical protein
LALYILPFSPLSLSSLFPSLPFLSFELSVKLLSLYIYTHTKTSCPYQAIAVVVTHQVQYLDKHNDEAMALATAWRTSLVENVGYLLYYFTLIVGRLEQFKTQHELARNFYDDVEFCPLSSFDEVKLPTTRHAKYQVGN